MTSATHSTPESAREHATRSRTNAFIALVATLGVLLSVVVWLVAGPPTDVVALALLIALAAASGRASVLNRVRGIVGLSTISSLLIMLAIPVAGPAAAPLVGLGGALATVGSTETRRLVFNAGMRAVIAAVAGLIYVAVLARAPQEDRSLAWTAGALALAVVVQCLLNAILVGAVVAISERTSLRGQALGLLSSTGLPYLGQGFVAYLLYVLWIPVGFGPSTLIFGGPAILATRWQLSQYGAEQRARQGALAALQTAIDVRSPAAARHTSEVAALCEGLAVALALPADEVDMLRTAGVLHNLDVLTVDRPTAGHGQGTALTTTRAMGQVTFLAAARPALEWQRIPYAARPAPPRSAAILAVADDFVLARERFVADHFARPENDPGGAEGTDQGTRPDVRPDSRREADEAARQVIVAGSGTTYDPGVVEALTRVLRRGSS